MFHWYQVWKRMHEITGREIEKRAIMELISHFEPKIDKVIKQSLVELEELNELRRIQGFDPKKRIDAECVRRAIKSINQKNDSPLPFKAGGEVKEKENEKHSPVGNLLTEVA